MKKRLLIAAALGTAAGLSPLPFAGFAAPAAAATTAELSGWYGTWELKPGQLKLIVLPRANGKVEGQIWEKKAGADGSPQWQMLQIVDFNLDEATADKLPGTFSGGAFRISHTSDGPWAFGTALHGNKSESWSARKVADADQAARIDALLAAFGGTWSGKIGQWWEVGPGDDGIEVKIYSGESSYRLESTIVIDPAASSTGRLKGLYRPQGGMVFDSELTLGADGQSIVSYTGNAERGVPGLVFRVDHVGAARSPESPGVRALLDQVSATVWNTPFGRLAVSKGPESYEGRITDAAGKILYKLHSTSELSDRADFNQILWDWEPVATPDTHAHASIYSVVSADLRSIYVGYHPDEEVSADRLGNQGRWTATRYGSSAPPGGSGDPNAPSGESAGGAGSGTGTGSGGSGTGTGSSGTAGGTTGGGSGPGGSTGTPPPQTNPAPQPQPSPVPATDGSFRQLQKYDVRLDRVETPRDDRLVHVYLTLKNATQSPQYVTSGSVQVQLRDSDGVTRQTGQVLRAVPGQIQLFGSTPVLQPGEELKVQFALQLDPGARPTRVIVVEGDKRAEF